MLPDTKIYAFTDVDFFSQLEVNTQIYHKPVIHFIDSNLVPFEALKRAINNVL